MEGVVDVARGGAVYADERLPGERRHAVGCHRGGDGGCFFGMLRFPCRSAFKAGAVQPEIVMNGDEPPGLRQQQGQEGIVRQAFGDLLPQPFVLCALRIGDASHEHAPEALSHGIRRRIRRIRARTPPLRGIVQSAQPFRSSGHHGFAPARCFLGGAAGFHCLRVVDLKQGRLKPEMAFACQKRPAAGGHGVGVGSILQQLGEPRGRCAAHFALGHFPELDGVHLRSECGAAFPMPGKDFHYLFLAFARAVGRSGPWQQARSREGGFLAVFMQQAQAPLLLLHDPGDMRLAAHEIFDDAAGSRKLDKV